MPPDPPTPQPAHPVRGRLRAIAFPAAASARAWLGLPHHAVRDRARWTPARARAWDREAGWLVGANFTPSTAVNQLELWQEATFDPATIDRELGWAAQRFGMNAMRVFLHDLAWATDPTGFLDRVDRVLQLADRHGIRLLPVLFDGIWDPCPRPGPQAEPRRGVHNSRWVQSPGAAVIADPARWDRLRPYVDAVLARFGTDRRVVGWDLFNEPDSPNPFYARLEPPDKTRRVGALVERVFDWAVAADPIQPLTVGVYLATHHHPEAVSPAARTALERSDVVSFHCYASRARLEATIARLGRLGRPLWCTEWLARPASPADLLDVLAARRVGAFNWGLVDGRTQTRFPWTSWLRRPRPDRPWFHDLLHADGRPYDDGEAARFRRRSGRGA